MKDQKQQPYTDIAIETLEGSEIQIKGEIPIEVMTEFRKKAIAALGKNVSIDGFRSGHIPEDVLIRHIGEGAILEETAELALARAYPAIVVEKELDVVGRPEISITKLAPGNPIGFTIKTAVMPKVDLPAYQDLAKETREKYADPNTVMISDEELDRAIKDLQKRALAYERAHHDHEHDTHDHDHPHEHPEIKDEEIQPLTDETVKNFGPFETVEDLKKVLREQMRREKETTEREKRRLAIIEAIIEKTDVVVPNVFIKSELAKMLSEFENTLTRMGLTMEQYFEKNGMNEERLREEWRPEALKRAKIELILAMIAKTESIKADESRVEREVKHLLDHYKDANPDYIRAHVDSMLTNEAVFRFLEDGRQEHGDFENKTASAN